MCLDEGGRASNQTTRLRAPPFPPLCQGTQGGREGDAGREARGWAPRRVSCTFVTYSVSLAPLNSSRAQPQRQRLSTPTCHLRLPLRFELPQPSLRCPSAQAPVTPTEPLPHTVRTRTAQPVGVRGWIHLVLTPRLLSCAQLACAGQPWTLQTCVRLASPRNRSRTT